MKGFLIALWVLVLALALLASAGSFLIGLFELSPGLFKMTMGAVGVWGSTQFLDAALSSWEAWKARRQFDRARARLQKGKRP